MKENNTKQILIFYFIVLTCLLISDLGIFTINRLLGVYSIGITLIIIPIVTISTLIYSLYKKAKK